MAEPPFVLLLVAADEADRRQIGELLPDGCADVHWTTSVASALAAVGEHPHDAVLLDAELGDETAVRALLEEDPRAQVILLGDPSGAAAVRAARAAGAVDHLPKTTLDGDTLERAVRYAADHRRSVERLQHGALHDALTGLPNRTLFLDRLEQSLRRARRRGSASGAAVLFLDLDRFKVVNDSLGHQAGDQLLQAVALRLDAALRPGDTVARMGGDEFTVLLEDTTDPREATIVAERMLATLAAPFTVASRELFVSASIGIALGGPEQNPEELIRDADVAMYRAKAGGKARHAVFDAQMHRNVVARLDLETDLRKAIETGSLQVLYQPIMRTTTREVTGFEALCRWDVEPRDFLAIADETGLIVPLGAFVLGEAARRAAEWGVCVSVNVSARQLADPDFGDAVEHALRASNAPPELLRLEVTESGMTQDPEGARRTLTALRGRLGVTAHLDDFGTGASSLRFLHRFPGDALKIDRGLVIDMLTDPGSYEIVKAIIGLAHNLGMEVVGEGVETAEHLDKLHVLGCELAQGFFLSPPLTAEAAADLLAPRAAEPSSTAPLKPVS
ncbi:MAG TPA: EAL domain-containing protein [Solirubrobacteraceae bacterium]|nr:EAL domain-containing protein [Solirubrobacteraceae bacterium]